MTRTDLIAAVAAVLPDDHDADLDVHLTGDPLEQAEATAAAIFGALGVEPERTEFNDFDTLNGRRQGFAITLFMPKPPKHRPCEHCTASSATTEGVQP